MWEELQTGILEKPEAGVWEELEARQGEEQKESKHYNSSIGRLVM